MGGFPSDLNPQQVLSQLANASQPITNSSVRPQQIYGGDLVGAVDILVKMAEYNGNQGNVSSTKDLESFAQVASNLLESTNSRTWNDLNDVRPYSISLYLSSVVLIYYIAFIHYH